MINTDETKFDNKDKIIDITEIHGEKKEIPILMPLRILRIFNVNNYLPPCVVYQFIMYIAIVFSVIITILICFFIV
jgi:hypothetical protein